MVARGKVAPRRCRKKSADYKQGRAARPPRIMPDASELL